MTTTIELRSLVNPKAWSSKCIECDCCGFFVFIRVDPTATVVNSTYGRNLVALRDRAAAVKGFASVGTQRVCWECFWLVVERAHEDPSVNQAINLRARLAQIEEVRL